MTEWMENSVFFGVFLTLFSYAVGMMIQKKWKLAVFNPLLISIILSISVILIFGIDYEKYSEGTEYLSYLLTPATICLAIPLYEKLDLLKKNYKAIMIGITSGVLTSLCSVLLLAYLFRFDHSIFVTMLPKSITTAIGIGISEELGGYVSLTASVIIMTGLLGNMTAQGICKLFKITEPVARGVAIGTSAHAMGTAKAMEMGETEGAVSSLAIVTAGILTVIGASIFAQLM